jgi:hypothetical protein
LMHAALVALKADPVDADGVPASAVAGALAALRTLVAGGWEAHDVAQDRALSDWLESTQFFSLFDSDSASRRT